MLLKNSILGQYQLNGHFISAMPFSFARSVDNSTPQVNPNILISPDSCLYFQKYILESLESRLVCNLGKLAHVFSLSVKDRHTHQIKLQPERKHSFPSTYLLMISQNMFKSKLNLTFWWQVATLRETHLQAEYPEIWPHT